MRSLIAESAALIQFGLARKSDFERLSIDDIKAVKSDNSVVHHRFVEHEVKADTGDEDQRTVIHVASSEHVDSMGDIIRVAGWDTTRLKLGKIPFMWGHDAYPVPMGLVQSAKKGKCEDGVKCLETKSRFHEADVYGDSEWGKHVESVRVLVVRGDIPGVSVGFAPKEYRWPEEEEREACGMPRYGMIFDKQELLELSVTPIPANSRAQQRKSMKEMREALRALVAEGKLQPEAADALAEQLLGNEDTLLRRIQSLSKTVVPITKDVPWLRGAEKAETPASDSPKLVLGESLVPAIDVEALVKDAVARVTREVGLAARREVSAVIRELMEPVEESIVEAAEQIERAVTQFGLKTADSERAEVSEPSASNEADAVTATSTGKGRENPIQTTSQAELLLAAVNAVKNRNPDANNADSRPRQEGGVQD